MPISFPLNGNEELFNLQTLRFLHADRTGIRTHLDREGRFKAKRSAHRTACIQQQKFDQTYVTNSSHGWVADGSRPAVKGPISRSGLPTFQMSENSVICEKVTNAAKRMPILWSRSCRR